jgi:curved DNA-binding protein CbpA
VKRSFYEVLGVARDADQSQIDTAYALAGEKLAVITVRGTAAAIAESKLLGDGYALLSNPDRRAEYDAKLEADDAAEVLAMTAMTGPARRNSRLGPAIFVTLAVVMGGIAYQHVSAKMEQVRAEHAQAVRQKMEEQAKVLVIDATHGDPVVINAANGAQKR